MALEKWELRRTTTALRGLLVICNHHAAYCRNYVELAAPSDEKLKVGKIKFAKDQRSRSSGKKKASKISKRSEILFWEDSVCKW